MDTILIIGLALVAGLFSTRLMKLIGLPDITGYLIVGLLIGPYAFNLISETNLEHIEILTSVALGFIAFSIGSSFKLEHLREIGKNVVTITFFQALGAVILVDIALFFIAPTPEAIILGAIATATAPAATLMVVRQYRARGPVTNTLLPVVALDDAVGLMIFSVSFAIAKVLALGTQLTVMTALVEPLIEIVLSLLAGLALGAILSFVSKLFRSRANRITAIIAVVFIGLAIAELFKLSNLLVCMMIGAMYSNLFKDCERPLDVLDRWTYPLYMMFFIISGAELDLKVIPAVGLIGIVYILVRSVGKIFGAMLGAKIVKADKNVVKYLGLTLLPQAGVAIGMAQMVAKQMPEFSEIITTVVLTATLVYELFGPLITKIALAKAGEIPEELLKKRKKKIKPEKDAQ